MLVVASVGNGLIMEVYPSARRYFNPTLLPINVVNAYTTVPEKPGLGIEFDKEVIRKYRVS